MLHFDFDFEFFLKSDVDSICAVYTLSLLLFLCFQLPVSVV